MIGNLPIHPSKEVIKGDVQVFERISFISFNVFAFTHRNAGLL